jgi:hypothetical protein
MDTINSLSEHLIALCSAGDQELLDLLLAQSSTIQTALSYETICLDNETGVSRKLLTLQRMLKAASKSGEAEIVEFLLGFGQEHGIAVNGMLTRETVGAALKKDPVPVLRKFMKVDPDTISRPLSMGIQMLDSACCGGPNSEPPYRSSYLNLVEYLLENGQDRNMIISYRTDKPGYLLFSAAWSASSEITERLLQHGAMISGSGAPRMAASKGRLDVLEILVKYGADLDEYFHETDVVGPGGTPLHMAVRHKQPEAVKWLLEHNADLKVRNEDGKTAGEMASADGDPTMIAIFERVGSVVGESKDSS